MTRVILVGATGRIGGATAAALRSRGVPFAVMRRPETDGSEPQQNEPEVVVGDVRDVTSMKQAFARFDTLLSVSPFATDIDRTGINMVEAAKAVGIRRIVRASALGASPDAAMELGRLHASAEDSVRKSGLEWTILQPATFMQNYLSYAATLQSEGVFYSPVGEGHVSLVDIRDVGEMAAAALIESGYTGKTWAVTGPAAISCAEIATLMSEKFGRTIHYVGVSDQQAAAHMRKIGMPDPLVRMVSELNATSRAGDAAYVSPDVEQVLGREPYSFADFLDANAAIFGMKP